MVATAGLMLFMLGIQDKKGDNLGYLHKVACEVLDAAKVVSGGEISNGGKNTTGYTIRVPGGTQTYYPAFWIRDAAMMLGSDFVPKEEVEGWIRVVAATQPGPSGLDFPHGLHVPAYSIPDHITLQGEACWYPGAYANQGIGEYGYLPPADDAFYFIQMVDEWARLSKNPHLLLTSIETGWGQQPIIDICAKAFDSVAVNPDTGLVHCSDVQGQTRVDWGFCDSIRKTGDCLMPSLLRWQAAKRMAKLCNEIGRPQDAKSFDRVAKLVKESIPKIFFHSSKGPNDLLLSATGLGRKDDVWATAFAVWLGFLPKQIEKRLSQALFNLFVDGGIAVDGQLRQTPLNGTYGGYWDQATSAPDTYQNGGFWATPTGWMVVAIGKVDRHGSRRLLDDYIKYLKANRSKGAPFEWINPHIKAASNGNYGSSAGLVFSSLSRR